MLIYSCVAVFIKMRMTQKGGDRERESVHARELTQNYINHKVAGNSKEANETKNGMKRN